MQENNYLVYNLFRDWHRDADGKDFFENRGIPYGFSFRLEIWNDLIFYVRSCLFLVGLSSVEFEALVVGRLMGLIASM